MSNLVSKAPDLNLGKKLSNLLSNYEILKLAFCEIIVKKLFLYFNVFVNTIITEKLCLPHKFINEKCHDAIYSDCE